MRKTYIPLLAILLMALFACNNNKISEQPLKEITSNVDGKGMKFDIHFYSGKYHNHPTFSFWLEDVEGNYLETLFVTKFIATGIFGHGSLGKGKWDNKPGVARRPAALPYWLHKRNIMVDGETYLPTPDHPVSDAITGATPQNDFVLETKASKTLPEKFRLMMEINQPWDWNQYWNNNLHPDDPDYKSSCQPALVYSVTIDQNNLKQGYYLNPIGHSSYDGKDGDLYTNLTTITTAKEIVHKVKVEVKK